MRLLVLYLRSRRVPTLTVLLVAGSLGIVVAGAWLGRSGQLWMPVALAVPLAAASLIVISGVSTMSELEVVASQQFWRLRGARLGLLTLLSGGCLVALATGWPVDSAPLVILRVFAILLGLGLAAAALVGTIHAWGAPALVAALGLIDERVMDFLFPIQPLELEPNIVAALILLAGLLLGSATGTRDERRLV